ncbi:hypothetical protein LTR35_011702 [Friedmanniomyces endolithicus]|nr:hypothetical protein LTR35_011702 [Friedmanniomyces endolithicus]KAK0287834.1 hypothetical protein LTS00_009948 [Friedmanniomyces endolithicus]
MSRATLLALAALPAVLGLELPGGVGRLPALGWNSWNAYGCDIDSAKIMQAANAVVSMGFKDAGYNYVNSDDCWSSLDGRDPTTHQLVPNATKFPLGIKGVADQVHGLGLKFGIYSSAGTMTCGRYPASLGYEMVDAYTFASWGVDYLKRPFCALEWPVDGVNYTAKYTALRFRIMENALLAQNRTILYSLCEWGVDEPWTWANGTGNSWRMSNDINPSWSRIVQILNVNSFLGEYTNFYGRNDPDMLEVGNGNLTVEEERTHFALWAMMKAPLIMGTDLTKLNASQVAILQNKYLLAFNQDSVVGEPAMPYKWGVNPDYTFNSTFPAQYWSGASSNGTMVAMFNPFNQSRTMTALYSEIPELDAGGCYDVVDAWTGADMGCKETSVNVTLAAHDTAVLLFGAKCILG